MSNLGVPKLATPPARAGAAPPLPNCPAGLSRFDHLATVEAAIVYWRAAHWHALDEGDAARARAADGLVRSYEDARSALRGE